MRVAVVAPSPEPRILGGAQRLWDGLVTAINELTVHRAELVALPSRESTLTELVATYERFSALDLSPYDMVVSTKYPAWMVEHDHHVLYLQHRLRGLYDTYPYQHGPDVWLSEGWDGSRDARALHELARRARGRAELPELFGRFWELVGARGEADPLFTLPGPLARQLVVTLDAIGLAPSRIHRYLAISRTVAARAGYLPPGVPVQAVHHPSTLSGLHAGRFEYLFTASRLDGPKRLDLLIDAMAHVHEPVRLLIAGSGPELARLRRRCRDDARIWLLGEVDDQRLASLYSDALAVPFLPRDEDLGLVALEAQTAGKPVVTTSDAGGCLELVNDGIDGLVVPPKPAAIGAALAELVARPALARRLGSAGRRRARHVSWERTVAAVLGAPRQRARRGATGARPEVVVTSTFPVHDPLVGGELRCYHLFRALSERFDVHVISLSKTDGRPATVDLGPGLRETVVPRSARQLLLEQDLADEVGLPVDDIVAGRLVRHTPEYLDLLGRALAGAVGVVLARPYLHPALRDLGASVPLVYDAHDVEHRFKASVLPDTSAGDRLRHIVTAAEAGAVGDARVVTVCCRSDGDVLAARFGKSADAIVEVPNGVALDSVPFTGAGRRRERGRLWLAAMSRSDPAGGSFRHLALFIGSWHPPNLEAARLIVSMMAPRLPHVLFALVGAHARDLDRGPLPPNVAPVGLVSPRAKNILLGAADVALNPVVNGSGTNVKLLEYFAAGVPVISTRFGARGLPVDDDVELRIAEVERFPEGIDQLLGDPAGAGRRAEQARSLVEREFNWDGIGRKFSDTIASALS